MWKRTRSKVSDRRYKLAESVQAYLRYQRDYVTRKCSISINRRTAATRAEDSSWLFEATKVIAKYWLRKNRRHTEGELEQVPARIIALGCRRGMALKNLCLGGVALSVERRYLFCQRQILNLGLR